MKKAFLAVVLAMTLPASVSALQIDDDLVTVAAMPLAVAAVADIVDVPTSELIDVVMTLNRANVPPPQFIEVVRYVPVALVDTTQPRFTSYLDTQYDQGLRGQDFAVAVEDRYETSYGLTDVDVVRAPRLVLFDDDNFLPPVVVSRVQPVRYQFDPLSLIAMPLAVAAVAELTDIPMGELASFVSLLNRGSVPPPQFVQVVRYAPVALYDTQPQFLTFVTTQVGDGVRGPVLARSIADRYVEYGFDEINVAAPPITQIVQQRQYLPPIVTTRLAETRTHPHGGPPGQLKKQLGLQTGAEVVHGSRSRVATRVVDVQRPRAAKQDAKARVKVKDREERQVARVRGNSGSGKGEVQRAVRKERREERIKPQPQNKRSVERVKAQRSVSPRPAKVERAKQPKAERGGGAAKANSGGGKGHGKGKG